MKTHKGSFPENISFNQLNNNQISGAEFDNVFTLVPKTTPIIIRKCARCEKKRFVSSDKFRINANKKVIDVWLIFKCIICENTLNISIISRKTISSIDQTLLNDFFKNDKALAYRYAFDPNIIEKGGDVDWAIEFSIERQTEIGKTGLFLIQSPYFLKTAIYAVLREIFCISRSQLDKMLALSKIEILSLQGKPLTLKNSIGFGCKVTLKE